MRDPASRTDVTTEPPRQAPARTPGEQRVLIELCRPVIGPGTFTSPTSVNDIASALFVGPSAVEQHLEHLYDKFGIAPDAGGSRCVRLANEAIQTGAVTIADLTPKSDA